jgi:hypothetical protein
MRTEDVGSRYVELAAFENLIVASGMQQIATAVSAHVCSLGFV